MKHSCGVAYSQQPSYGAAKIWIGDFMTWIEELMAAEDNRCE